MPALHRIDKGWRALLTTFEGFIGVNDVLRYAQLFVKDSDFVPHFNQLSKNGHIDSHGGGYVQQCALAAKLARHARAGGREQGATSMQGFRTWPALVPLKVALARNAIRV